MDVECWTEAAAVAMKGRMSTPTDTLRSDEPDIPVVGSVWTRGVIRSRCSSRVVAFQAADRDMCVYRVDVQLRTMYTRPDAAGRWEWGLLEARGVAANVAL